MAEKRNDERRNGIPERRNSQMDRRQFIDIGLALENERRRAPEDRRQRSGDRRRE